MIKLNRKKIISIALIVITILSIATQVMAVDPNQYDPRGKGGRSNLSLNKAGQVLGYIRLVGIIVAVASLMVIGIKFMLASAEEKAEYKKKMIPYIIGFIMLIAIISILTAIQEFANFE